jgi:hypothetical protein
MQTLHGFPAQKAMMLSDVFRIELFVGLGQLTQCKPLARPRRRLRGVDKWS